MRLVRGTLRNATQANLLGFHNESATNPAATPITSCSTYPNGTFSVWLDDPCRYLVSVNRLCWAKPDPRITVAPDDERILPVPVPNPPGLNLKLISDCTNREPTPPPPGAILIYRSEDLVAAGVTEPRVYLNGYKWELQKEEMDASDGNRAIEIALVVYLEEGQAPPVLNGVEPISTGEGQA